MTGKIALEDFGQRGGNAAAAIGENDPEHMPAPPAEVPPPPEQPEPDPEALRNASLARVAAAIETLAAEQADLRSKCIGQAAAAMGMVAQSLLPALVRAGFAALVAETAKSVAERGQWPELVVSLEPGEAKDVSRYLAGAAAAERIRIDARPGTAPGEAAIAWEGGGAEIDLASMAETILTEYRLKLDSLAQTGA